MCEYCEKDSKIYEDYCNSHDVLLEMRQFSENKVKLRIDLYCSCTETSFLQYIEINYCPICGKKLGE